MPASAPRTVDEHLAVILDSVGVLERVTLPLREAAGSVLAEPVRATRDAPAFRSSAMDGFAVRAEDTASASVATPARLRVVAELPAGTASDPELEPGEAARIMTGAPVPTDADAVVPLEHTVGGLDSGAAADVVRAARAGQHVRPVGEDVRAGTDVVPAGALLTGLRLGAIAAAGIADVVVTRHPRVAIVSTGSELLTPGRGPRRGLIPESNGPMLARLAEEAGAEIILVESVSDDSAELERVLQDAASADVVITSGGVGTGAYEVVRSTLDLEFVAVAMRPGRPQGFGRLASGALAFALPGTPIGSAVSFEVFVRPALLAMQGRTDIHRPVMRLRAGAPWRSRAGFRQYVPAVIDRTDAGAWSVAPAADHTHSAAVLARIEAYFVVPEDVEEIRAGDCVDALLVAL